MSKTREAAGLWEQIMDTMKADTNLGEGSFGSTFLSQLKLCADTGSKLIFEYPKGMMIEWVQNYYLDSMTAASARVLDGAREIEFVEQSDEEEVPSDETDGEVSDEGALPTSASAGAPRAASAAAAAATSSSTATPSGRSPRRRSTKRRRHINSGLNEDFLFENFVVGPNSEFAYEVAKAVAEGASTRFNPFFIHGGSGLGKTHLLHAIGNAISEKREDVSVLYVTCEDFANAYIDAIGSRREEKSEAIRAFRRKYREADVLLIDDVQFLSKRQKTQDEFFYTFNSLFDSGKQIVMTADCAAHEITDLDPRLSTRFEQGLTASISLPALETRLAILRNMRSKWKSDLVGDDVLEFLATNITRSVRSLAGALTRIGSLASFSHHRPSVAEARLQVRDLLHSDQGNSRSTIEEIQRRVAEEFDIRVSDLTARRRTAKIAHPRQVAMYLARRCTQSSLQDIGAAFGGRDHGTVIHAMRTIEQKIEKDGQLRSCVERLAGLFS